MIRIERVSRVKGVRVAFLVPDKCQETRSSDVFVEGVQWYGVVGCVS